MRIMLVSDSFVPESNAPSIRGYDHCRAWVDNGHDVSVVTSAPNCPEGVLHSGYKNRFSRESIDGIEVYRVPTAISENSEFVNRSLDHASSPVARFHLAPAIRLEKDGDVWRLGPVTLAFGGASHVDIEDFDYAPEFNRLIPSRRIVAHFERDLETALTL